MDKRFKDEHGVEWVLLRGRYKIRADDYDHQRWLNREPSDEELANALNWLTLHWPTWRQDCTCELFTMTLPARIARRLRDKEPITEAELSGFQEVLSFANGLVNDWRASLHLQ